MRKKGKRSLYSHQRFFCKRNFEVKFKTLNKSKYDIYYIWDTKTPKRFIFYIFDCFMSFSFSSSTNFFNLGAASAFSVCNPPSRDLQMKKWLNDIRYIEKNKSSISWHTMSNTFWCPRWQPISHCRFFFFHICKSQITNSFKFLETLINF